MLLITGATGTVGSELVKDLSAQGVGARVLVRDSARAGQLPSGMTAVAGDFTDRDSLMRALDGVDTAFLLAPFVPQMVDLQASFVDAAKAAGVQRIVKVSAMGTTQESPIEFMRWHAEAEEIVKNSSMTYTFLHPNGFMQNLLGMAGLIGGQGIIPAPAANARISHIDVRDIAAAAAQTLTGTGHEGVVYTLTGPEAVTYEEMAADVSAAIGKTVNYVPITDDQFKESLISTGAPEWLAKGLDELYASYRAGNGALVTVDVERLTGKPATPFAQFAKDYANVLKG